jgi:predicted nucleic acid-binding protein
MIILDTNVISELMRPKPEEKVIAWLDRLPSSSLWISSVTVFEIGFGFQGMSMGKRRDSHAEGFENLLKQIDHRVAPFDYEAAQYASRLTAARKTMGRPRESRDTMIAGIVLSRHATLATRNTKDFDDISAAVINPWTANCLTSRQGQHDILVA